jgi:hypothetical protein
MSKRLNGILLMIMVLTMFLGANNFVFANDSGENGDTGDDEGTVSIKNCEAIPIRSTGGIIHEDHDFNLEITVLNGTSKDITLSKIEFSENNSFSPEKDNEQVLNKKIEAGGEETVSFLFSYIGLEYTELVITLTYTDEDGEHTLPTYTKYINNIQPKDPTGGSGSSDPSKYKPVLAIYSAAIPEGKSGGVLNIPLTITNYTDYEARRVRITPLFADIQDNPFVIDRMMVYEEVARINKQKPVNINLQFTIDKFAKTGTYTIPLKITYKNIYGVDFEETIEVFVKITNTNVPAQLAVIKASSNPSVIMPEQEFTVAFDLWNTGTLTAENVTVDIENAGEFHVLNNITKQYFFELKGLRNIEVTYQLKSKKDMETGTYPITILLSHKEAAAPEKYTMYVYVEGEEEDEEQKEDVDIVTENITTPKETVLAGQPFTVSMDVKNTGTTAAENVKITVESDDKILPQSLNVMIIKNIEAGESVPVAFSFIAGKECESRSYPIKAVIEYQNGEESVKKEQYMGVLVECTEEKTTLNTIPKIIISEYSTEPGMVNAGENFTLNMKFLNTSKLKSVQNMKITLVVDESSEETGSVFTPVQSSNTFYIDNLEPGESSEKEMIMYTIPDAKAKTYVVKALFEYEYEEQDQIKQFNMQDVFGIPVVQPAKLETTDVIVSEPAFVGEPVYLTAEFYNMGKVTLSNLMIKAEGDFDTKESNYFVGNFEMGRSDYYEAPVTPLMPGELHGVLVFTFEDAAGQSHRIEREFTINAMESMPVMNPDFPGGGMMPGMNGEFPGMDGPQKSGFPVVPVAIGGGVVVLIVVLIIILKKRKKKKEMMFDEDI